MLRFNRWYLATIVVVAVSLGRPCLAQGPQVVVAVTAFNVTGYTVGGVSTGVILRGSFWGNYIPGFCAPVEFTMKFVKVMDFISPTTGWCGSVSSTVGWLTKLDNPLVQYLEWGDNPATGCQLWRDQYYPQATSCLVTYRARIEAWKLPDVFDFISSGRDSQMLASDEMRANYTTAVTFGGGGGSIPP